LLLYIRFYIQRIKIRCNKISHPYGIYTLDDSAIDSTSNGLKSVVTKLVIPTGFSRYVLEPSARPIL